MSNGSNRPEKQFRSKTGGLSANIWKNTAQREDGSQAEFYKVTVQKSYLDDNKKFQTTNSYSEADVPKIVMLMNQAYAYLELKTVDPSSSTS